MRYMEEIKVVTSGIQRQERIKPLETRGKEKEH